MFDKELTTVELDISWTKSIQANEAWGSIFHGMLMESLTPEHASWLHEYSRRPYSQCLYSTRTETGEKQWHWRLSGLTAEAVQVVVKTAYELPDTIYSTQKDMKIFITGRRLVAEDSYGEMAQRFLGGSDIFKSVQIFLDTPTGFKNEGNYAIYPELKLIIANLLRRWNTFSTSEQLDDPHIADALLDMLYISNYRLSMKRFALERTRIPAFSGWLSIGCKNSLMMQRLMAMLFQYATYSGIGIKTALGMGGVHIDLKQEVQ